MPANLINASKAMKRILTRSVVLVGVFCVLLALLQVFFHIDGQYNPDGNLAIRLIVDAVLSWSLMYCSKQFWE